MPAVFIESLTTSDFDVLHPMLRETYWSPGITREAVVRAANNSICAVARNDQGALIGYARMVTDQTVFAWVCDVIVAPDHRGQGIGRALVSALMGHPECQGIRRWMLGTLDAHEVYAKLGFKPVKAPERLMEVIRPARYDGWPG